MARRYNYRSVHVPGLTLGRAFYSAGHVGAGRTCILYSETSQAHHASCTVNLKGFSVQYTCRDCDHGGVFHLRDNYHGTNNIKLDVFCSHAMINYNYCSVTVDLSDTYLIIIPVNTSFT